MITVLSTVIERVIASEKRQPVVTPRADRRAEYLALLEGGWGKRVG